MKDDSPIRIKSKNFALQIIQISELLIAMHHYVLSNQLLRAGTSIGANVVEAQDAQSKPDFISKLSIALKEAREAWYWLELLRDAAVLDADNLHPLFSQLNEVIALLTAILNTSRKND